VRRSLVQSPWESRELLMPACVRPEALWLSCSARWSRAIPTTAKELAGCSRYAFFSARHAPRIEIAVVHEIARAKYCCRICQMQVLTAPDPTRALPKALLGSNWLAVLPVAREEPQARGDLRRVKELTRQRHHAVHEVRLDEVLANLALARLVGRHRAVGEHEAGDASGRQVV